MAKQVKVKKAKAGLANDIRASWREALKYAREEKADVILHRVVPSESKARAARLKLRLSGKTNHRVTERNSPET